MMTTKKEDLAFYKGFYAKHLKGRKNPSTEERFEAGFDCGYDSGLMAAWRILHSNKADVIKNEKKNSGFLGKYHASFSVSELMNMVMSYKTDYEPHDKYKPVECYCDKCGKLK